MKRILWLTWKDHKNPMSGGAELVNEEIARRLAADGFEVIFLVAGYPGCESTEVINGYTIVRLGTRWTVYLEAWRYYNEHFLGWADLVIDEMNTMPFFAKAYCKEKNILFVHQLCREIWFYQLQFPLNLIGYLLEPFYCWLLRDREVITVSESTRKDLLRYGFKCDKVHIISEGISIKSATHIDTIKKYPEPTLLSLGAIRDMKRTHHQLAAFEKARSLLPNLKLKIAGAPMGHYGPKVLAMIRRSPYASDIEYLGKVSDEEKRQLMQRAHLLLVTSVKEGWGIIVTEANSQGTPAVVYNIDGLRDSVKHNQTGLIVPINNPSVLGMVVVELLSDREKYEQIREKAWQYSQTITFDRCYHDFRTVIDRFLTLPQAKQEVHSNKHV